MLRSYQETCHSVYLRHAEIANLIDLGTKALRARGHIYYLGAANLRELVGSATKFPTAQAGVLGQIDASECPPTYGAEFEDVRGFLHDGWRALIPGSGADLSSRGAHFGIALTDFREQKLPKLSRRDLCVFLGDFRDRDNLLREARRAGAMTAIVEWTNGNAKVADVFIRLFFDEGVWSLGPLQLQIKLVLNALTTGAHVMTGKVFGNRMIDLRISNNNSITAPPASSRAS